MAPKYWMTFAYASIVAGALGGGRVGYLTGLSMVSRACDKPDAGNLCGLIPSSFIPVYVIIGAVIGALIATALVVWIVQRQQS